MLGNKTHEVGDVLFGARWSYHQPPSCRERPEEFAENKREINGALQNVSILRCHPIKSLVVRRSGFASAMGSMTALGSPVVPEV